MEFSLLEYGLLLFFPAVMILAGVLDMLTMTIPNRISFVLVGSFLVVALISGLPLKDIGLHFAVGFIVLVVGIAMFALGLCGGGDSKLLAASSLWIGFDYILPYVLHVAVFGGVLTIALILYRKLVSPLLVSRFYWAYRLHCPDVGVPYGLAIAGGALSIFPATAIFQALTT